MALPLDLAQDVDPVVVAQGPGHLVVVHRQVVLLDPPQPAGAQQTMDLSSLFGRYRYLSRYSTRKSR